jgi:hypothetical protein
MTALFNAGASFAPQSPLAIKTNLRGREIIGGLVGMPAQVRRPR